MSKSQMTQLSKNNVSTHHSFFNNQPYCCEYCQKVRLRNSLDEQLQDASSNLAPLWISGATLDKTISETLVQFGFLP